MDLFKPFEAPRENKFLKQISENPLHGELLSFYKEIESKIPWSNSFPTFQSGLNTRIEEPDDLLGGCGALKYLRGRELEYTLLAPFYHNTLIEKIISEIPLPLCRMRWMKLMPKSCYSIHQDPRPRIHIPVITNPQAHFVFAEGGFVHLEVGKIYWIDTTQYHSFMNGGEEERVHLVAAIDTNKMVN